MIRRQHLIIFAHPNGVQSFNNAILERVLAASHQIGVQTQVRDLYRLGFNPILSLEEMQASYQGIVAKEIQQEQQFIQQADFITLIYPIWWMGFPAILKGYFDRVLSHGFAYKTENGVSSGLLGDKKMQQFITLGSDEKNYAERGWDRALDICLVNGLFNFCAIKDVQHRIFGKLYAINFDERRAMLDEVEQKTLENLAKLN